MSFPGIEQSLSPVRQCRPHTTTMRLARVHAVTVSLPCFRRRGRRGPRGRHRGRRRHHRRRRNLISTRPLLAGYPWPALAKGTYARPTSHRPVQLPPCLSVPHAAARLWSWPRAAAASYSNAAAPKPFRRTGSCFVPQSTHRVTPFLRHRVFFGIAACAAFIPPVLPSYRKTLLYLFEGLSWTFGRKP